MCINTGERHEDDMSAIKLLCIKPHVYCTSITLALWNSLQTYLFLYEAVIIHSTRSKEAALERILPGMSMKGFSVNLLLRVFRIVLLQLLRDGTGCTSETNGHDMVTVMDEDTWSGLPGDISCYCRTAAALQAGYWDMWYA